MSKKKITISREFDDENEQQEQQQQQPYQNYQDNEKKGSQENSQKTKQSLQFNSFNLNGSSKENLSQQQLDKVEINNNDNNNISQVKSQFSFNNMGNNNVSNISQFMDLNTEINQENISFNMISAKSFQFGNNNSKRDEVDENNNKQQELQIHNNIKNSENSNISTGSFNRSNFLGNSHSEIPVASSNFVSKNRGKFENEYDYIINDKNQPCYLGRGGFGTVVKIKKKNQKKEEFRALKIIKKDQVRGQEGHKLIKEIEILKELEHPNIIKVYEYYENADTLYIIQEFCNGRDLFKQMLEKKGKFTEKRTCEIMKQLLSALQYAHNKQVIHRDIKLDNIIVDFYKNDHDQERSIIKVIDWGLSALLDGKQDLKQKCGTAYYVAPEIIKQDDDDDEGYNNYADIWSCGIVMYILLSGTPPYEGNTQEIFENLRKHKQIKFKQKCWEEVSKSAIDLMKKMLKVDPIKRYSAEEALAHPWFELQGESNTINTQELQKSYGRLKKLNYSSKLQQIVMSFIASQLIPKEEQRNIEELFMKLDDDKNGKLSKQEFIKGFQKLFRDKKELEEEFDEIFLKIDTDNDGEININEFKVGVINLNNVTNEDNLKTAFNLFDRDNDGEITKNEIKDLIGQQLSLDDQIWENLISEVDQNHDGVIQFQEFKQLMLKLEKESATSSQQQF